MWGLPDGSAQIEHALPARAAGGAKAGPGRDAAARSAAPPIVQGSSHGQEAWCLPEGCRMDRILAGLAALAGLSGVALSAAAAHGPGGPQLETAGRFLLVHAAALLGLAGLMGIGQLSLRIGTLAGLALVLGLLLFCGDLVRRAYAGSALFPMAAPRG